MGVGGCPDGKDQPADGQSLCQQTGQRSGRRAGSDRNPTFIKDFTKELYALQDKRLLGTEEQDIAILSVKTRTEQFTLVNQNGEWALEDAPTEKINQQTANLFVSRLASVPAEERVPIGIPPSSKTSPRSSTLCKISASLARRNKTSRSSV